MESSLDKIFASKAEHRKKLSELPFLDKVVIIKRMQGRNQILKSAKARNFKDPRKAIS